MPQVISTRKQLLGVGKNEKLIAGDMFTLEWIKAIDKALPTMIIVSGVYQYFHEDEVVGMIKRLKTRLPHADLIFDAANAAGLKVANQYVKKLAILRRKCTLASIILNSLLVDSTRDTATAEY